jgi:peptidoglycan/LPS O-acetylase OafA/YrhL
VSGVPPPAAVPSIATRLDPRANSLNAIRLVLAGTVLISHSWPIGGYGPDPTHGGFAAGGWAVDGFFVLSGYLVTGSRLNNSLYGYLRRRVLRIYPGFLVCLLLVVVVFAPIGYYHLHHTLSGYLTTTNRPTTYFFKNLGLDMRVGSVAGTPGHGWAWAGTLWTLWYEFLCYLLVGLVACWGLVRRRPEIMALLFVVATGLSLRNDHVNHHTMAANLIRLVPFFLAGTVVYQLREKVPATWWLAAGSAVFCWLVPYGGPRYLVLIALPMTYLLLYLGAVVPITLGRRNDISYGIYMYGWPSEQFARLIHFGSQAAFIAVSLGFAIPLATLSWFVVERPAMRWRNQSKATQQPG